ncbi:MAG: hypothetical protein J7M05_12380 [Anaerolineae bacterium]|nr:hypothetical protein [Anaerolineae bacterium]
MTFLLLALGSLFLIFVVLGFITLNRYISYRERVALAQLGFSPEDLDRSEAAKRHSNRGVLWGGVITAMSGLALLLGLATLGTGAWLLAGLLPLFVGLGMVLIYFLTLGASPLKEEAVGCTGEDLVEAQPEGENASQEAADR